MARESFDKEIQLLRMLALTSGAHTRQQYAEKLGISVHTLDKTIKRLKEVHHFAGSGVNQTAQDNLAEAMRYSYLESSDALLLFLYRSKSLKESECQRIGRILTELSTRSCTAADLLETVSQEAEDEGGALIDEKTIRQDLKFLESGGIIRRTGSKRPFQYEAEHHIGSALSTEELRDLYDFVDIMSATQNPSVQGYLLRDTLRRYLTTLAEPASSWRDMLSYKYHYHARILDEAHLPVLLEAIQKRQRIAFNYFTPKQSASYAAKQTNPLFSRSVPINHQQVVPLQLLYDHQYGRWYLIAHRSGSILKFRMDGMTDISLQSSFPDERWEQLYEQLKERTRYSWVVDTGRSITVRARFFSPMHERSDFVRDRVERQGQWGIITEESDASFLYEIQVNSTIEIKPWLRSFGSSCEVLEPAHLRKDLIAEWQEIGDYYETI